MSTPSVLRTGAHFIYAFRASPHGDLWRELIGPAWRWKRRRRRELAAGVLPEVARAGGLFGIGYSVGPKFAKAMKGDGRRFAVLGVFVPVVGLLVAWAVARVLDLDPGFAGGLVSGALTESPAIGTASEAIQNLGLAAEETERLIGHVAVGDALCYVFGAFGVIWFCGTLGPRLLGIDLVAEATKLEQELGIERNRPGVSYSGSVAIAHVLLPMWSSVIVFLIAGT